MSQNSFDARDTLDVGGTAYDYYRLDRAPDSAASLPYSLKILLENLLRNEDGDIVSAADIEALAAWDPAAEPSREILFTPARVLLQDFTGVPAVVDLAVMRDAMAEMGGDASTVDPLLPADLVIDHSIIAEVAGVPDAFIRNAEIEFERNAERYAFLRWGQGAFERLRVVPPNTGIVHQVNLEYLARVVFTAGTPGDGNGGRPLAYPDTLVGTDSHTPMVNGLGVLGWGVGGIEAEAAMLGQPVSMLIPKVVGFELTGALPEGATATDLVLTVTEMLREHGVVGSFVEFYGEGVSSVPLVNRATIGNMSPEYGSTVAIFPVDQKTLDYLAFTGRSEEQVALVEAYTRAQGLFHDPSTPPARYSTSLTLDLSTVVPSLAGPTRPQDRIRLDEAKHAFRAAVQRWAPGYARPQHEGDTLDEALDETFPASDPVPPDERNTPPAAAGSATERDHAHAVVRTADGEEFSLDHGDVVIAAITSCTNTSNPSVMLAAGLLARNAVERGLETQPWVKASLAPGSKVVMDYYNRAGLLPYLEKLRFNLVGFGCTTCIGNSGPLDPEISEAVNAHDIAAVSVLSGNRNFEGRINPDCKMNYLASPPLVVAYALAGSMDVDLYNEPLGTGADGQPVYLRDIWPTNDEITALEREAVRQEMFDERYADVFTGDERWQRMDTPTGDRFAWDPDSTYVRRPTFFDGLPVDPVPVADITGARCLALLGDSVTTDHISPAGSIKEDSPAGRYLVEHGVSRGDFNSYGSRRGNHEVMVRGTFANIRLRNLLAPGTEGGVTRYLGPDAEGPDAGDDIVAIYDAAQRYAAAGTPLVVLAGTEYGSGSSRDWAAKGTAMLGVRAVLAESYERIHRSNLIGMGVLPLQFAEGDSVERLGLDGTESFDIVGLGEGAGEAVPDEVTARATADDGGVTEFTVRVRIDTPREASYYRHGGILQYVLRRLRDHEG
jgi:aconitate hydratase